MTPTWSCCWLPWVGLPSGIKTVHLQRGNSQSPKHRTLLGSFLDLSMESLVVLGWEWGAMAVVPPALAAKGRGGDMKITEQSDGGQLGGWRSPVTFHLLPIPFSKR